MFSPPFTLAFASVEAPFEVSLDSRPARNERVSTRVQAMLGRGLGRGAPASHTAPLNSPPAAPQPSPSSEPNSNGLAPEFIEYVEAMGQNIAFLRQQLGEICQELSAVNGRGADSARVFDALHAELGDYKRDFVFAHIKPLLRPLLFLYDSLDGFDGEMKLYEDAQAAQTLAPDALRGAKVRDNIAFLRDQLIEALSVCEVEPMPIPVGKFDAHFQKAIQIAPVAPELDGTVVCVIRIGWTLNGHVLRPAEVIVGKSDAPPPGQINGQSNVQSDGGSP